MSNFQSPDTLQRRLSPNQRRANQQAGASRVALFAGLQATATKIAELESAIAALDPEADPSTFAHGSYAAERSFLEGRLSALRGRQRYIRSQA